MNEDKNFFYNENAGFTAVRRYENMLKYNESRFFDVEEFEEIIEYYLEGDELKNAAKAIDIALQQHPYASYFKIKHAQLLINENKPIRAIKILNKLEKIEVFNEEILILKAFAHNQLGNIKDAVRNFEKALTIVEEGEKEEVLYNIGVSFQQTNQYKLALKYLLIAYKINKTNTNVLYELGFCYEKSNNYEKSIAFYKKYLDEDPFAENVWFRLGTIYDSKGEYNKAIEAYDFALAIEDDYSLIYLNKASTLIKLNRYHDAIKVYEDFLEIEEDFIEVYCYIGECYEQLQEYDLAFSYYNAAFEQDNEFSEPLFAIGRIKLKQENYKESIAYLIKAIKLDQEDEEYWYYLAEAYKRAKINSKAIKCYERCISLNPDNHELWISYALFCFEIGQTIEAIEILTDALYYQPDKLITNYYLAGFYFSMNSRKLGMHCFEEAFHADPTKYKITFEIYPAAENYKSIRKLINK
jgi:tetratricopeptide (TPR) repeat protein